MEKVKYLVDCKFYAGGRSTILRSEYYIDREDITISDNYGGFVFEGTKEEFDKLLDKLYSNEQYCKVIGIWNLTNELTK